MANSTSTPVPTHHHVYYRHQSKSIPFAEWITLLTLCLAPLLTHVAFGYASPVLLCDRRPGWRDRLPQFNPIVIIWRWYAIVNRRLRATNWDRADMACTNAIFWTSGKWEGSEELMTESRNWITKQPEYTRVNWVSSSTLATVAMTLQGVASVIRLRGAASKDWTSATSGLPDIFFPLAVLSFARLPASPWLCKDYSYERTKHSEGSYPGEVVDASAATATFVKDESPEVTFSAPYPIYTNHAPTPNINIEIPSTYPTSALPPRLNPPTSFLPRLWTIVSVLFTLLLAAAGIYISTRHLGPRPFVLITQLSSLLSSIFYLVLSISGALIISYYTLRGRSGETVLPCMNSGWFRFLNVAMMALAFAMLVASALETKVLDSGQVTTYPIPPPK